MGTLFSPLGSLSVPIVPVGFLTLASIARRMSVPWCASRDMAFWRRVRFQDSSDEKTHGSKTTRVFSQLCQKSGQMGIR